MLHSVHKVSGTVLWANLHLLFWLSIIPFTTAWMGENHFEKWPVILYGLVLLMAAIAYFILAKCLVHVHGKTSTLAIALNKDWKGILSIFFISPVFLSLINPWIGFSFYVSGGHYVVYSRQEN